MIPSKLRKRLEAFVDIHENCDDRNCVLKAAEDWIEQMADTGYPRKELLLLALAFQAYAARDKLAAERAPTLLASIARLRTTGSTY